jgi:hypothetical protein
MLYWTPSVSEPIEWQPKGGWNTSFSEKDKIQCINLFFFFKNNKGFKDGPAEMLSQMVIYKQKYHGMKYSKEQEAILSEALKPIFV